ncbi:NUDIX domain-containing protein [Pseudaminobacter sp. 19-2017]|uniref:NUDIX domain-containing protein n=1 Tax=Pseudaminobacter soli (ex Zhang et al. 2022) TaxID=2831468 RepID=A0A942DY87_9HYPH|nr:NUDIX domain-containing protein [Pseudaminobacter soli]MBS3649801.1 NUDIX domain-containing protein [Pseudaminobacter soli]
MPRRSAGILAFRSTGKQPEVLLVHPGGPFWRVRDAGAWSIPKGEHLEAEEPQVSAIREFTEETGWILQSELIPLGQVRQSGGKIVTAFAAEADFDTSTLNSNLCDIEWPPRSGRSVTIPEVDRAEWFTLPLAREKIIAGQLPLIDRLQEIIGAIPLPDDE